MSIGVDVRSNDVVIRANALAVLDLETLLRVMDVPDRSPREIELKLFPLRYLSADEVAHALDKLLGPRLGFCARPGKDTVAAFGDANDLKVVGEVLSRLDQLQKRAVRSRPDELQKK